VFSDDPFYGLNFHDVVYNSYCDLSSTHTDHGSLKTGGLTELKH
jgi:hypothetical protein